MQRDQIENAIDAVVKEDDSKAESSDVRLARELAQDHILQTWTTGTRAQIVQGVKNLKFVDRKWNGVDMKYVFHTYVDFNDPQYAISRSDETITITVNSEMKES